MTTRPQDLQAPVAATPRPHARVALVIALFFLSGAAGLVYEVAWSRLLVLQMGNTAQALSTILAVLMGGLAIGALIGGRIVPREGNHLRTYGLLEVGIGLSAALLPAAIAALHPVMVRAYASAGDTAVFNVIQFIACGAILVVPAILMGATLPVVVRIAAGRDAPIGRTVGLVYGANTAGACVGAMAAGFVLIPEWGLARANLLAVATSLAIGAAALLLSRRGSPASSELPERRRMPGTPAAILLALAASGFASMTYEVAWTRLVTLVIGPSAQAFSLVVGAFILGLALGAALLGRLGDSIGTRGGLLIACQLGVAATAALSIAALGELPVRIGVAVARHGGSFWRLEAAEIMAVLAVILAPTILLGATFPLACRALAADGRQAALRVGQACAGNAVGTIAGAFLAGFVLLPLIGVQRSVVLAVAVNSLAAAMLVLALSDRSPWWRMPLVGTAGAACVTLALLSPPWDMRLITSAPYLNAPTFAADATSAEQLTREMLGHRPAPLFHAEDAVTTVTVTEERGRRILWTAGEAAGLESEPAQSLLAHVPLLLHPAPHDVLIIGLGAGGTLASALRHDEVLRVDCVEISPAVRDAMERFFQTDTRPLDDPRVRLRIGDGRAHVALTAERYDAILSQPGNPWMAGSSTLFTREAFEDMRSRLNDGGIVAAWVQGWMPMDALMSLVATFHSVFPDMDLWESGSPGHYLLTGYLQAMAFEPETIEARISRPGLSADLRRFDIWDAADLLGYHLFDRAGADRISVAAGISTDDLDRIGTLTARQLRGNDSQAILLALGAARTPIVDRLAEAVDGGRRGRFVERTARIVAAKELIVDSVRVQEKAMRLMSARRTDEAAALVTHAQGLLDAARELNPRDPAVARRGAGR